MWSLVSIESFQLFEISLMLQSQNSDIIVCCEYFNEKLSALKGNRDSAVEVIGDGEMPLNGCVSGRSETDRSVRSDLLSQNMDLERDKSRILVQEVGSRDDGQKQQIANSHFIADKVHEGNSHDCKFSQSTIPNDIHSYLSNDRKSSDSFTSEINNRLSDYGLLTDETKSESNDSLCSQSVVIDLSAVRDSEQSSASESQVDGLLSTSVSLSSSSNLPKVINQIPRVIQEVHGSGLESASDLSCKDETSSRESGCNENSIDMHQDAVLFSSTPEDNDHCHEKYDALEFHSRLSVVVNAEENENTADANDAIRARDSSAEDRSSQKTPEDSQLTVALKTRHDSRTSTTDSDNVMKVFEAKDENSQEETEVSSTSDLCNDVAIQSPYSVAEMTETAEKSRSVISQCNISESDLLNHLTGDLVMESVLIDDDGDSVMMRRKEQRPSSIRLSTMSLSQGLSGSNTPVGRISNFGNVGDEIDLDETEFVEINLQTCNSDSKSSVTVRSNSSAETNSLSSFSLKTSRLGNFLTKNFSLKKLRDREEDDASGENLGWKLFGRIPPRQALQGSMPEIVNEYRTKSTSKPTVDRDVIRRSNKEVPSTTALILQPRPSGLPSKNPEEELKHKMMYDGMIEAARRSEQKEVKLRKKQREQQIRHEEELSAAVRIWNTEILPNWETTRTSRKTQDLWWRGIPPSIRGKVWKLAIGNDLNVTAELYEICLVRAREKLKILRDVAAGSDTDSVSSFSAEAASNRESSVDLIQLDVSRTFPQLCIYQAGGPYHKLLQGLLGAYVCYRPDVGYVQGMSFLAAVLLLNMDDVTSFICFANLLNKPCELAFFRLDENLMKAYFDTYQIFFKENLPKLYTHFDTQRLTPDLYIIDWMYTLFAKSLPLDVASRVWDMFCRDGEEFLFRTALGILKLYEDILLHLDFIHLAQFLTRLPEAISGPQLFHCIGQIRMQVSKSSFGQVLAKSQNQALI